MRDVKSCIINEISLNYTFNSNYLYHIRMKKKDSTRNNFDELKKKINFRI